VHVSLYQCRGYYSKRSDGSGRGENSGLYSLTFVVDRSSGKSTFSYLCDHFMVSPRLQRMMTIFGTMTLSIHLAACISWLVRVITNQPHEVEAFLEQLSSNPDAPIDLGSAKGKAEVYVISAYFCTTVFSTVGFGDIVPTNTVERVMAILLMLAGVLIFGNLLSDLADIGHAANAAEVAKLKKVQSALDLMQHQDVPKHLQLAVIDWIRFHHTHIESSKKEKDLLAKLPLSIQQQLIQIIFGKTLKHIPIFEILGATDSDFLRGVWSVMRYATYEPNATIIPFGAEASRLIVIVKGECEVSIDPRGKSEQLEKPDDITLMPGGFLGEFAILGDQDWGSSIAVGIEDCVIEMAACNHTFVVCMELEAKTFKRLLAAQPVKLQRIVDIFRRNRLEHKETFQRDSATTMRKTNSLQGPKMEIADFVRESRQIHHWDTLANNVLTRYRKAPFARTKSDHSQNTEGYGEETQAFSGTIAKFMNTDSFTMAANMKAEVLKGHQTLYVECVCVRVYVCETYDVCVCVRVCVCVSCSTFWASETTKLFSTGELCVCMRVFVFKRAHTCVCACVQSFNGPPSQCEWSRGPHGSRRRWADILKSHPNSDLHSEYARTLTYEKKLILGTCQHSPPQSALGESSSAKFGGACVHVRERERGRARAREIERAREGARERERARRRARG